MSKAAFLYTDLTKGATVTGSPTVTGLDWSFLKDPQPRHRARVNDVAAYLIIDLGAVTAIDVATLIGTSMDVDASYRLRTSASDPSVTTSLAMDSGVQNGLTRANWSGNVIQLLTGVPVRYLRWDLTQATGPIDIGLAPCGLLWRPSRNFTFGGQEGRIDSSQRDVNSDTGAEFGLDLPKRRTKQITFSALTMSEVRNDLDNMDCLIGTAGDVLFVEDAGDSPLANNRSAIWGSFRAVGGDALSTRSFVNVFSRSFVLTERL